MSATATKPNANERLSGSSIPKNGLEKDPSTFQGPLGQRLLRANLIAQEELEVALTHHSEKGQKLVWEEPGSGDIMVRMKTHDFLRPAINPANYAF